MEYYRAPHDPDPIPCETIDCELWDFEQDKCKEGYEPGDCPEFQYLDEDTLGDMDYHRRVDEGEIR